MLEFTHRIVNSAIVILKITYSQDARTDYDGNTSKDYYRYYFAHSYIHYTPCPKKTKQICFCQNFVNGQISTDFDNFWQKDGKRFRYM